MFSFYRMLNTAVNAPSIVELATTASTTYKVGDALVLTSGKATIASGTTKPTHICAADYVAPATGMAPIATYPITSDMEWKTKFDANGSSIVAGNKVTIGTAGETVTATTTSGVAEVVQKLGSGASGTEVIVKF